MTSWVDHDLERVEANLSMIRTTCGFVYRVTSYGSQHPRCPCSSQHVERQRRMFYWWSIKRKPCRGRQQSLARSAVQRALISARLWNLLSGWSESKQIGVKHHVSPLASKWTSVNNIIYITRWELIMIGSWLRSDQIWGVWMRGPTSLLLSLANVDLVPSFLSSSLTAALLQKNGLI